MKDWKAIARASGLRVPDDQLERIATTLDGLEAAFRPLVKDLPAALEPATFVCEDAE